MGFFNTVSSDKGLVSQVENRQLKQMPVFTLAKLTSGELMKEFEDYYSDNFIFRETIVKISKEIKKLKGIPQEAEVIVNAVSNDRESAVNTGSDRKTEQKTNDNETETDKIITNKTGTQETIDNNENEVVKNYIITADSAIEIHYYKESEYEKYAQTLNAFRQCVSDQVTMYSMVIPTPFEFMKDKKYKKLGDSESQGLAKINSILNESIVRVNAYNTLKDNSDKYLYFRTDIHWTGLGAYYAYTAFMDAKNEPPVALESYEKGQIDGYLGTLYGATLNQKLAEHPDTIFYYKPFTNTRFYACENSTRTVRKIIDFDAANIYDKYCLFLGGLRIRGEFFTETLSTKKLLVIKDSFGNAFIPFLLPHYQEIYVVDPRACDINIRNYIKEKGINEILIMNNVFSITNYDFASLLQKMIQG